MRALENMTARRDRQAELKTQVSEKEKDRAHDLAMLQSQEASSGRLAEQGAKFRKEEIGLHNRGELDAILAQGEQGRQTLRERAELDTEPGQMKSSLDAISKLIGQSGQSGSGLTPEMTQEQMLRAYSKLQILTDGLAQERAAAAARQKGLFLNELDAQAGIGKLTNQLFAELGAMSEYSGYMQTESAWRNGFEGPLLARLKDTSEKHQRDFASLQQLAGHAIGMGQADTSRAIQNMPMGSMSAFLDPQKGEIVQTGDPNIPTVLRPAMSFVPGQPFNSAQLKQLKGTIDGLTSLSQPERDILKNFADARYAGTGPFALVGPGVNEPGAAASQYVNALGGTDGDNLFSLRHYVSGALKNLDNMTLSPVADMDPNSPAGKDMAAAKAAMATPDARAANVALRQLFTDFFTGTGKYISPTEVRFAQAEEFERAYRNAIAGGATDSGELLNALIKERYTNAFAKVLAASDILKNGYGVDIPIESDIHARTMMARYPELGALLGKSREDTAAAIQALKLSNLQELEQRAGGKLTGVLSDVQGKLSELGPLADQINNGQIDMGNVPAAIADPLSRLLSWQKALNAGGGVPETAALPTMSSPADISKIGEESLKRTESLRKKADESLSPAGTPQQPAPTTQPAATGGPLPGITPVGPGMKLGSLAPESGQPGGSRLVNLADEMVAQLARSPNFWATSTEKGDYQAWQRVMDEVYPVPAVVRNAKRTAEEAVKKTQESKLAGLSQMVPQIPQMSPMSAPQPMQTGPAVARGGPQQQGPGMIRQPQQAFQAGPPMAVGSPGAPQGPPPFQPQPTAQVFKTPPAAYA